MHPRSHFCTTIALLLWLAGTCMAAVPARQRTPQENLDRAILAVEAGAYGEALREMKAIVDSGHVSAALLHNIGNLEYRRGDPGQAALWYHRALLLNPLQTETRQNLRVISRQTGFLTWDPQLFSISLLPERPIYIVTVIAGWLVLIPVVWLLWWTPRPGRRWPLVLLLVLASVPASAGGVLLFLKSNDPHPVEKRHVVTAPAVAYTAPAEAAATVITLPPGTCLVPLESRGAWRYCEIPSSRSGEPIRGWVREGALTPLWPWPAERWTGV